MENLRVSGPAEWFAALQRALSVSGLGQQPVVREAEVSTLPDNEMIQTADADQLADFTQPLSDLDVFLTGLGLA